MASLTNVTEAVPPQLSVAVILPGAGCGTRLAHWTVTGPGHVNVGAVLSNTDMICVHDAEFPHSSVAL